MENSSYPFPEELDSMEKLEKEIHLTESVIAFPAYHKIVSISQLFYQTRPENFHFFIKKRCNHLVFLLQPSSMFLHVVSCLDHVSQLDNFCIQVHKPKKNV